MNNQTMTSSNAGLNQFYAKVYGIFAVGLGISAIAAYFSMSVFQPQMINFVNNFPLGLTGIWIVQLILVLVLGAKAQKNPTLTLAGFIVYSLLNGMTLSITLFAYQFGQVTSAFISATVTFAVMAFFGAFTKRDLSTVGRVSYGLLIGIIVASVINIFLGSQPVDYLISFIGIFIFMGLIAYDNQRIRQAYFATQGQDTLGIATFLALQLYLDFINLFLSILRLSSRNN